MSSAQGPIVSVDDRRLISLSSNDYLGLTHHPRLREAALEAVRDFGAGSGAVRTIAGTMTLHEELERDLAAFKGTEATLTFQSGFTANTGVIPTITGEQDLIVSRRAQPRLDHRRDAPLEGAPEDLPARRRRRACARSSTRRVEKGREGTGAPLSADPRRDRRRLQHGRRHRAAAGDRRGGRGGRTRRSSSTTPTPPGVLGRDGRGSVDHFGLHGRVAIQVGTLSKAVGVLGGYVAGSQDLRDILVQRARPFLFSTSHPPAVAAACREAIRVMQEEPELHRAALGEHAAVQGGARAGSASTPAARRRRSRPVMMGDPDTAGRFSQRLFEEGVFAQPVVFPTVAIDKARIRTIVTAAHADDAARPGARGVRHGRPRARPDRGVSERRRELGPRRPIASRPATCRSTPTSTPTSRPTATSRSTPTPRRPSSAGSPRSRSPTTSTSCPARRPSTSPRSTIASGSSARPPSAGRRTASRSGSASRSPTTARTRTTSATTSRGHAYDFVIGSVHVYADSPFHASRVAAWIAGRPLAEIVAPYFDEVLARDPVRACSTRSATSTSSSATSCRT